MPAVLLLVDLGDVRVIAQTVFGLIGPNGGLDPAEADDYWRDFLWCNWFC
jgi:hypothetical protein